MGGVRPWAKATTISAAIVAKEKGAHVIAFTGSPGSELEGIAHCCLCSGTSETSVAQEIHQLSYHIVCDLTEKIVCKALAP